MKVLTPEQLAFYTDQGYVLIEEFLSPAELEELIGGIERVVAEKAAGRSEDHDGFNYERRRSVEEGMSEGQVVAPGLLRKIQEVVRHVPEVARFSESDKLLDLVEDLIGPDIYYHSSKVMFKPARHGGAKPWHQDFAYWATTQPEQVTVWIALDDATPENGCMQLIPASHKWGPIKHYRSELQVDLKDLPACQVRTAPMKAGALLAFNVLTFHHSPPNRSERGRRALIFDFDPNPRPETARGSFAGDRPLRLSGRRPTPEETVARSSPASAV